MLLSHQNNIIIRLKVAKRMSYMDRNGDTNEIDLMSDISAERKGAKCYLLNYKCTQST